MSGRNLRSLSGRPARLRIRGRGRGHIIRGVRSMRGFRGSRIRQRGDYIPVNINRSENIERDYVMAKEDSYQMKHYSERYRDENKHYHYRSRSRSRSISRSRSRSISRSISRSPYRHILHHRHYSRSRSRSYSPHRRRSRSMSRSMSRSPPRRHRISRSERTSTERRSRSRKRQEENRKKEMVDRLHSRPVEKYVKEQVKKQPEKMKEQVKAVKDQVKKAKEQGKIAKEQFKKMIPLPEVVKKESPPSVKDSVKLPLTIKDIPNTARDIPNTARDMPIYSEDESEDDDFHSRIHTPQTKKEERFKFETDIGKDIRSQLLERAMIEKKKLGLENPGAAEKSSALEALQCYSPETHSPPTSQHNYESLQSKRNQKKKKITKSDPFATIPKSSEALSSKSECLPSIPGLGFSSIEDEEKFLYGDDDDKDNENKFGSGDEEEEEEDDDDDFYVGDSSTLQPEVKPKFKAEVTSRSMITTNILESSDWSSSHTNPTMQSIPSKRLRLLTSDSDNNIPECARNEDISKPYISPTVHHEMLERKYSASDMIDLQLPEKLRRTVTDSPSQFMKRSLSPPIKKIVEKGNKLEYASQFEAKPSPTNRRKDFLEERHPKYESPSNDFERASNKKEKYFHSTMSSHRSKREESPPKQEPRYKSRHELYEETTERKHRERTRKTDSVRSEETTRDWEESPRRRSPDRSPWRSPEERKKWDSYREYSRSPRNASLERSSGHSRSPRESYYDRSPRSPSHSPRWNTPRREIDSSRWSPRREISPRGDDSPNGKSRDWPKANCRDHYYDRWHSPSQSPDKSQSRSPSWNKEYKSSYQQQAVQSFDSASVEAYTTSQPQQLSNISTESTDATSSYTVPQQNYYQPVYQSVNPHMTYPDYNTAPFCQTAPYNAPFQSNPVPYMNIPPTGYTSSVIQIDLQPPRAPENVTRTNLTVIPLQNEIPKPKENKPILSKMLEEEKKNLETSKRTFVTISDSSQYENSQPPVIDYSKFSYKELVDKMTEKKKHLILLRNEMAKLCKMQGEMMRKKQKEKDGHKDALIVENTKLQEEVGNQIQESKQELSQITQAIKNYYVEAEKKEEEKRNRPEKQLKKEKKETSKEEEKEENQKLSKNRREERVEIVSDDQLDDETNFSFKYFDPGNHWCKVCNEVSTSIYKLFEHLHNSNHKQKMDPCDRPWTENLKKWSEKSVGSQSIAAPIKGVQFLVPLEAFYCSICKDTLPDASSAEEHLKSTSHNRNYTKYILLNSFYERRWNLDKAAGIAAAEKEEKKRLKELLIEAKIKKKEEAERRRKEATKNEKAKVKEVKRFHDTSATAVSHSKPFESSVTKDANKSKHKGIRLTLLGDKGKLTKQKKEEKTAPPKDLKPVPVIYIGKAPNFRSMSHKQDRDKQDTSGFGKFNWKRDENEIVPEDQTLMPEDLKPKQEDQKPKQNFQSQDETKRKPNQEETEFSMEKPRNFPLRKNKKPQLNIVYGPEPPPDLHLHESLQASTTPERTDDGRLPSEIDIAQAFAGKFEGNEESSTNGKKQGTVEDNVINRSADTSPPYLVIDETSPKQEMYQEEVWPAAIPVGNMTTGPSRQMMLMLKSVESMSKESQSNLVIPKMTNSVYMPQPVGFATTENSHLLTNLTIAKTGNISRIQPIQIMNALKPPGEDIFFTESNVKPPPPKPQCQSENKSKISLVGNVYKPLIPLDNVNKSSKIVMENISKPITAGKGNVNKPSTTMPSNTNMPTTIVAGNINRSSTAVIENVNKLKTEGCVSKPSVTAAKPAMVVENKVQSMETGNISKSIASAIVENANKSKVTPNEIAKTNATTLMESVNKPVIIKTGNIIRIQPSEITSINKSEANVNLPFAKLTENVTTDAINALESEICQRRAKPTENVVQAEIIKRPKVQIIFPSAIKSMPEAVPVVQLKENLLENEVTVKPLIGTSKSHSGEIRSTVKSIELINLPNAEATREAISSTVHNPIQEKAQSENEPVMHQSECKMQSKEISLKTDENVLNTEDKNFPSIVVDEDMSAIKSEGIMKGKTVSVQISLEDERNENYISKNKETNQSLDPSQDRNIPIQEQDIQDCISNRSAELRSTCRSNEADGCIESIAENKFSNKDKAFSSFCDSEALTAGSVPEAKFSQQIGSDEKEIGTNINSFKSDDQIINTTKNCNMEITTIFPECKDEQISKQTLCDGTVENSGESIALSSGICERSFLENKLSQNADSEIMLTDGMCSSSNVKPIVCLHSTTDDVLVIIKNKQEETETRRDIGSSNSHHPDNSTKCVINTSASEAASVENILKPCLGQESVLHFGVERAEMIVDTKSDNQKFDNEALAVTNSFAEKAEAMEIDSDNSFISESKTNCVNENTASEVDINESLPKYCLEQLNSTRNIAEETESMEIDSDEKTHIETSTCKSDTSESGARMITEQENSDQTLNKGNEKMETNDMNTNAEFSKLSFDIKPLIAANNSITEKESEQPLSNNGVKDREREFKNILSSNSEQLQNIHCKDGTVDTNVASAVSFLSENELMGTTDTSAKISKLSPGKLEMYEKAVHNSRKEVDMTIEAESVIKATSVEHTVTEFEIKETSRRKNEEIMTEGASSNQTEVNTTCSHSDSRYSCDEEALNLNEDTVEFCESPSPKENVSDHIVVTTVDDLSDHLTFPKTENMQCDNILCFKNTELSADNITTEYSTKIGDNFNAAKQACEEIGDGTNIFNILGSALENSQMEVDAEIKITSSPQEEVADEIGKAGLVIPVGLSPSQQTEDKTSEHCQKEKSVTESVQHTFGMDDADATIQALENLLEETKQLQSPVAKSSISNETTDTVEAKDSE